MIAAGEQGTQHCPLPHSDMHGHTGNFSSGLGTIKESNENPRNKKRMISEMKRFSNRANWGKNQ